jgi:hypothetical protein
VCKLLCTQSAFITLCRLLLLVKVVTAKAVSGSFVPFNHLSARTAVRCFSLGEASGIFSEVLLGDKFVASDTLFAANEYLSAKLSDDPSILKLCLRIEYKGNDMGAFLDTTDSQNDTGIMHHSKAPQHMLAFLDTTDSQNDTDIMHHSKAPQHS